MILQLAFVLTAIIIGARLGGIGLGVMGGVGLAILTFVFGLQPTAPAYDVMLMIAAVISAAACMQAAGGLDYMVKLAEHLLRKNPSHVTLLSPLVTYLFTFVAGTGHVAYSVLPVIAEVATETKIRPERPLGIAVIASQQAITASPISAATVALLSMLTGQGFNVSLFDILMISVPCTLAGVLAGAFYSLHVGKELEDDPEFKRRIAEGEFTTQKYELKRCQKPESGRLVGHYLYPGDNWDYPVRFYRKYSSGIQWAIVVNGLYYRNTDVIGGCHHFAGYPDRRDQGGTGIGFLCRHAGGCRYLRYCLDGRYLPSGKYGTADSFY